MYKGYRLAVQGCRGRRSWNSCTGFLGLGMCWNKDQTCRDLSSGPLLD